MQGAPAALSLWIAELVAAFAAFCRMRAAAPVAVARQRDRRLVGGRWF
jgi:hypothetical protein